jgi:DNA mismatch endonuclease (patch repair protein)
MPDVHDRATRSRNMAAIKGKDTKPELIIRKGLHARGFRYRLHDRKLPGRPDLVLPKYHAVILSMAASGMAMTARSSNGPVRGRSSGRKRSARMSRGTRRTMPQSIDAGWRRAVIWECALKGPGRMDRTTFSQGLRTGSHQVRRC